jgi:hypothetical protein
MGIFDEKFALADTCRFSGVGWSVSGVSQLAPALPVAHGATSGCELVES